MVTVEESGEWTGGTGIRITNIEITQYKQYYLTRGRP